jgi:hypothetical protein
MPSYNRDRTAPTPNRPRLASDESVELRLLSRDDLAVFPLWPAATPIRDAYLTFDGTPVVA